MNDEDKETKKVRSHRAYQRALRRAEDYLKKADEVTELSARVRKKMEHSRTLMSDLRESLYTSLRLLKAWANGSYRAIPWNSLLLLVSSLLYFVTPIDSLPDFIPLWGFVDDAALLGWTLRQLKRDLDDFRRWEITQENPADKESVDSDVPESDNAGDC